MDLVSNQQVIFVLQGFITLNLIFALTTLIAYKTLNLRLSGSSVVASIALTWPSALILLVAFPDSVSTKWVVALFMMCLVVVYVAWLAIFQPDNLQILARKNLRKLELKKNSLAKDYIRKQIKEAKKNKKPAEKLEGDLTNLHNEERLIKQSFSKFNGIKGLFRFFKNFKKDKKSN